MEEFLNSPWFSIGGENFTFGEVLFSLAYAMFCTAVYLYFIRRFLPRYFTRIEKSEIQKGKVKRVVSYIFYLSVITGIIYISNRLDSTWNPVLFKNMHVEIRLITLFQATLILQISRLADWIISGLIVNRFYNKRDDPREEEEHKVATKESAGRTVQMAVYIFAAILILTSFNIDYTFYDFTEGNEVKFSLRISSILSAILVLFIARLITWVLTEVFLYSYYKRTKIDPGSQYALNQLLKYVIYLFAIIIAFQQLGIKTTLFLGGLAALLVGVGLGLQQTFNDFFSGIILLFERSVELGDVLTVDGMVGKVKKIGVRASHIETRDNVTVVVPNSKLVTQNVINWSHEDPKVRFWIQVPVPYGSDTTLVKEILLNAAKKSPYVLGYPSAFVRLTDFADSALMFELHFWSKNFIIIEDVKSDMRLQVDQMLKDADISIPFPQRDVWIRTDSSPSE
jgi:small-conductance mechanosensitive channel